MFRKEETDGMVGEKGTIAGGFDFLRTHSPPSHRNSSVLQSGRAHPPSTHYLPDTGYYVLSGHVLINRRE